MTSPIPPARRFCLRGEVGEREEIFYLDAGRHVIGSHSACEVVLAGRGVSRRHAELRLGAAFELEDLESKNGTFHNGRRVTAAEILAGDRVGFGSVELVFDEVEPDDAELAISLAPVVRAAAETRMTATLAPEPSPGLRLEVLEEFVERLGGGDLAAALAFLHWTLGCRGIAVLEEPRRGAPVVLASCGEIGDVGLDPESVQDRERVAHAARRPSDGGHELALVVWGEFEGHRSSAAFLRLLLRLIDELRPRAAREDTWARQASDLDDDTRRLVYPVGYVAGVSPEMKAIYRELLPLAESTIPVFITGETGVGKEWMARILHASSSARRGAFVAVNCAAIPADLAEAELFGIGKGVATGVLEREGKFLQANGGTLFLDEIGEMPLVLQAKLLRTLQEAVVYPVGGTPRRIDVRIVAATNADLEKTIEAGHFRRDLYYRLAGYVLELPPLRECRADIPSLVEHFLRHYASQAGKEIRGITVKALRRLTAYAWPGNVRQLEHEVRRLVYLCPAGQAIGSDLLSSAITRRGADPPLGSGAEIDFDARVRRLEEELITEALRRTRGVQLKAAKLLGISRSRLARKMKELAIEEGGDL